MIGLYIFISICLSLFNTFSDIIKKGLANLCSLVHILSNGILNLLLNPFTERVICLESNSFLSHSFTFIYSSSKY